VCRTSHSLDITGESAQLTSELRVLTNLLRVIHRPIEHFSRGLIQPFQTAALALGGAGGHVGGAGVGGGPQLASLTRRNRE